jgi:ribonuclease P protein component
MSGSDTRLSRSVRIRHRPEFERVYEQGTRISARFMTVFVIANGGAAPRLGVAATRKLGSAVERNRAKRLARELFRRRKLPVALDIVIVPRRDMLDASFASLESDYHRALERRDQPRQSRPTDRRGASRPRGRARV